MEKTLAVFKKVFFLAPRVLIWSPLLVNLSIFLKLVVFVFRQFMFRYSCCQVETRRTMDQTILPGRLPARSLSRLLTWSINWSLDRSSIFFVDRSTARLLARSNAICSRFQQCTEIVTYVGLRSEKIVPLSKHLLGHMVIWFEGEVVFARLNHGIQVTRVRVFL